MREGWEYKKLGECFTYIKNGANIKQKKNVDGYPITRIETLSGGVFNRDRVGYAGIHDLSKYADYILEPKDLLMSHINSKTYIGRTVEYKLENKETIIHGMNLLRLKANFNIIDSTFFTYYTQSGDFRSKIARIRKDAVNQSSFAISDLKRIDVPLPPKSTQLAIVSELDKINELIRLKKEQLKDFDNLAQSIFYEMFGDPVENEKGWETKRLGDVCIYPANRLPISEIKPQNYVGVENLQKNRAGIIFSEKLPNINSATEFILNDILIGNIRPYLKKIWIANKNGGASGDVVIVRIASDLLLSMYLFKVLASDQFFEYDNTYTKGAKMPRGDRKAISNFPIPLPPLHLQHLFAHRIEQIEHQKAEVQKAIADLETLLASRMQYWFE